ncbi:MAG: tetratricopeptide repeat protein [Treponema sp.]
MKKTMNRALLFFLAVSISLSAEPQEAADVVAVPNEPEIEPKPVVSRTVTLSETQRLEISYPGHGWVYIGEQTSQQGLRYEQRKLQDKASVFTFAAEKNGQYVLHFSYFDVFTDDFITDAIAVTVKPDNSAAYGTVSRQKTIVRAPAYKKAGTEQEAQAQLEAQASAAAEAVPLAQAEQLEKPASQGDAPSEAESMAPTGKEPYTETNAEALTSEELLKKAQTAIAGVDAAEALRHLEVILTQADRGPKDEALFLQGQAYELNGKLRNIRLALEAYQRLTSLFPQSSRWVEADKRIRYIKEYYINIR